MKLRTVALHAGLLRVPFPAVGARVRFFPGVDNGVCSKILLCRKRFHAHFANVRCGTGPAVGVRFVFEERDGGFRDKPARITRQTPMSFHEMSRVFLGCRKPSSDGTSSAQNRR